MAIDNFIPTIWSARLLIALTKRYVYAGLLNRNYEMDARTGGNTVRIGTVTTDITVGDYARNTDLGNPQILDDSTVDLALNQQKSFHFYVDDIDRYQSTPNLMDEAMRLSGVAVGDVADKYAAGVIKDGRTTAANLITRTDALSSVTDGWLPQLRELRRKMKEGNIASDIPTWLVVPPKFCERLEAYILDKGIAGNLYLPATTEQTLMNGFMGRLLGFMVYESNNVPTITAGGQTYFQCYAGTMDAGTYAEQIASVEAYRPEKRFGDAVKGLYVYGARINKPAELFELRIRNS